MLKNYLLDRNEFEATGQEVERMKSGIFSIDKKEKTPMQRPILTIFKNLKFFENSLPIC